MAEFEGLERVRIKRTIIGQEDVEKLETVTGYVKYTGPFDSINGLNIRLPIHYAASNKYDNFLAVREILRLKKANVNIAEQIIGWTALFYAVSKRNVNIVKELLHHPVKLDLDDSFGKPLLCLAVEDDRREYDPFRDQKRTRIVKYLLRKYAPVNARCSRGDETPLTLALRNHIVFEMVKYLLKRGADVHHLEHGRRSCLYILSCNRTERFKARVFIELMKAGASLIERNPDEDVNVNVIHLIVNAADLHHAYKLKVLEDLIRSNIVVNYTKPMRFEFYDIRRFDSIRPFADRCYEEVNRMRSFWFRGLNGLTLHEFFLRGTEDSRVYDRVIDMFMGEDYQNYSIYGDCIAAQIDRKYLKRKVYELTAYTRIGETNEMYDPCRISTFCEYLSNQDLVHLVAALRKSPSPDS